MYAYPTRSRIASAVASLVLVCLVLPSAACGDEAAPTPAESASQTASPQDDPLKARLDAADADFRDAMKEAAEKLSKMIDRQYRVAVDKGDLEAAKGFQAMRKAFEENTALPEDTSLKVARKQYEADRDRAMKKRAAVYEDVVKAYTKAEQLDRAEAVRKQRESFGAADKDVAKKKRTIPQNAIKIGNHSYAIVNVPASREQAAARCEEMGGYLAKIESDAEFEALLAAIDKEPVIIGYWVNGSNMHPKGGWRFDDGTPIQKFFWGTKEPPAGQYGIELFRMAKYRWNALSPSKDNRGFICEWD